MGGMNISDMAHDVVCPYHDFECAEGDKKLLAI